MTPPWVGTFGTQIQSRPQPPRKLLLPQLLHVGAPVLRPTFYTLPLFMAPPVTYQPGPPASLRLQTLGAQPPTQLHFWTYSLDQGALPIRQLHLYHPLPHTSSKGVPSLYRTQDLEVIWTWDPSQCTEPRCSNPMPSSLDPPAPFPQPGSIRIEVVSPSPPPNGWLGPLFHPLVHTLISLHPLWLQSSGKAALSPAGACFPSALTLVRMEGASAWPNGAPSPVPPPPGGLVTSASHANLFSGSEYFC